MREALFISKTAIRGKFKDRWQCPYCKEKGSPESRFNLSDKKRGKIWRCRFCKKEIMIPNDKHN